MSSPSHSADTSASRAKEPFSFLNAYELSFPSRTPWQVSLYSGELVSGDEATHAARGGLKSAVWDFWRANKPSCPGPQHFVLDIDESTIAVPASWSIPHGAEVNDYRFVPIQDVRVNLDDPEHDPIVRGLLREAFKRAFKRADEQILGPVWQHYNDFCQIPNVNSEAEFIFCRKFGVEPVVLNNRRWFVQVRVSTQTVDGLTIADYFRQGNRDILAERIEAKRENRLTRKRKPTDVAALRLEEPVNGGTWVAERLTLDDPDALIRACRGGTPSGEARRAIRCRQFGKGTVDVLPEHLRLILDTQITLEDHRETILSPQERVHLGNDVRDVLDRLDVYGVTAQLAEYPVDIAGFDHGIVTPPAIRARDQRGESVIPAPDKVTAGSLRRRGRERSDRLKKYGLLRHRPLNPLLACPSTRFSSARAERLLDDLNMILDEQRLPFHFTSYELYRDAHSVQQAVIAGEYDSAFVVLPERRDSPQTTNSTHEQLKRKLQVPSQCIMYDNTYYDPSGSYRIAQSGTPESHLPSRIRDHYTNCIWGLAVKNHYVPFAPAEAFHYGVHIGIDVGGRDNNKAMVCVGYGFRSPRERLMFLADELPVDSAKAEPIPLDALSSGILGAFEKIAVVTQAAERPFDISTALFLRDGPMLGDGGDWNEREALTPIWEEARRRGWVGSEPRWTVAEISKSAAGWRPLGYCGEMQNPLVGQWIAPFEDPNRVVLSTTGCPYLPQGTASPLLVQISDFIGVSRRMQVLRDIVWEADMCFTKPDMGMKVPWVLYVANEGALQAARRYEISGVPV